MKKLCILCVLILLLTLCGCDEEKPYPYTNKEVTIESVELLYYPWYDNKGEPGEFVSIKFLSEEETESFMESLYKLPTKEGSGIPPSRGHGAYIARVSYENGDVEYFGSRHIELVESGEDRYGVGLYYYADNSFEELFFQYAGDISHLTEQNTEQK